MKWKGFSRKTNDRKSDNLWQYLFLNVIFFHKNAERFKVLLRVWEYDQGYKISLFVFYDKLFEDSLDVKANIGRFIEQCLLKRVIEKEISLIINVYVIH